MLQVIDLDINKQFNGFLFNNVSNKLELKTKKISFLSKNTTFIDSSFLKDNSITYLSMKKIKSKNLEKNKVKNLFSISNFYDSENFDHPIYHTFYHYKNDKDVIYGLLISKLSNTNTRLNINRNIVFFGKVKGKTVLFIKDVVGHKLDIENYIKNTIERDFNSIIYRFKHIHLIEKMIFSNYIFNIAELNKIQSVIYNDFPFLKNKEEKNIFKLYWVDICLPIYSLLFKDYHLFEEYLKEYTEYSKSFIQRNIEIKHPKHIDMSDFMSETNQLKQFKKIVPKANKDTIFLFNKPIVKIKINIDDVFYFSFMNLFHSPEKMNEALQHINVHNQIFYSFDNPLTENELELIKNKFAGKNKFDDALINHLLNAKKYFSYRNKTTHVLDSLVEIKNIMIRNERLYKSIHKEKSKAEIISYKKDIYMEFVNKNYSSIDDLVNDLYNLNSILEGRETLIFYKSSNLKTIENSKFTIKEIKNSGELKIMGKKFANCLFSYKEDIKRGDISVFYIRNIENNELEACIEYNIKESSITQVKKKYNSLITNKDVINVILEWAKTNDISINRDDLIENKNS